MRPLRPVEDSRDREEEGGRRSEEIEIACELREASALVLARNRQRCIERLAAREAARAPWLRQRRGIDRQLHRFAPRIGAQAFARAAPDLVERLAGDRVDPP